MTNSVDEAAQQDRSTFIAHILTSLVAGMPIVGLIFAAGLAFMQASRVFTKSKNPASDFKVVTTYVVAFAFVFLAFFTGDKTEYGYIIGGVLCAIVTFIFQRVMDKRLPSRS